MSPEGAVRAWQHDNFELIETFRWEPPELFVRLGLQMSRLQASAAELGFPFDLARARENLNEVERESVPLRIKMTLSQTGEIGVTAQRFTANPPNVCWRLRIAKTRLRSDNRLLRHKTSQRDIYNRARSEYSVGYADEVLLLNELGELSEGTITNAFVRFSDGKMLTPALQCGLLRGVLREELLARGEAIEARITVSDLSRAKQVYVGNSLRGLMDATLEI